MTKKISIEGRLAKIWQTLLGNVEICHQANFFTLGGDDFLYKALLSSIQKEFSIVIPFDNFSCAFSFYQQVELINDELGLRKNSLIVPLNHGEEHPLVVFIHPLGGTLFGYKKLVNQLDTRRTILGIQEQFFNESIRPYSSLEEQASVYINQINNHLKEDEVILAGHSSGGTIAFEMASQLLRKGRKVKHLIMFDSWVDVPQDIKLRESFKNIMLRQVSSLRPDEFFTDHFSMNEWLSTLWERMELLMRYVPQKIDINASLFIPKERVTDYKLDHPLAEHWKKYIDSLEVFFVQGNHENMFDEKNFGEIVSFLNIILNEPIKV